MRGCLWIGKRGSVANLDHLQFGVVCLVGHVVMYRRSSAAISTAVAPFPIEVIESGIATAVNPVQL